MAKDMLLLSARRAHIGLDNRQDADHLTPKLRKNRGDKGQGRPERLKHECKGEVVALLAFRPKKLCRAMGGPVDAALALVTQRETGRVLLGDPLALEAL
eukprot:6478360-Amphidinium_carterae.1